MEGHRARPKPRDCGDVWVSTMHQLPLDRGIRLFCLPHAGGGSSTFRGWQAVVPHAVEVCPVRLPGREMRVRETAITDFRVMVDALANGLDSYFAEPYALFGHSMGASLAYELMACLAMRGRPLPRHLFVSARQAPHLVREVLTRPVSELNDAELLEHLVASAGGVRAAIEHTELASLVLPVLRADFELCQSYTPERRAPFPVPLTVLGGTDDPGVGRPELEAWSEHTTREFQLHFFQGDHLFITARRAEVGRFVGAALAVQR